MADENILAYLVGGWFLAVGVLFFVRTLRQRCGATFEGADANWYDATLDVTLKCLVFVFLAPMLQGPVITVAVLGSILRTATGWW